ncbi:hypothetical protein LTR10_012190 [Elasticomyces elasticus]|nr:hypothetical protein LTR10_012190 [Elasticomyces elasticus]KAK4969131.1 hypothetical protein LTR42_009410 [Elasticomyces elasticus]
MAHLYLDSECRSRSALMIWTNDELRFYEDMMLLRGALTRLGIRVYTARLDFDNDIAPLSRFLEWTDEHDGQGNQLVLAYFGHAQVWNGRLMGAGIDLTSLQEYLRDRCVADALSILGTCFSGAPPWMMMPANLDIGDTGIVETLAVCNGRTLAYCDDDPAPWVQSLVWQLDGLMPGDAMTVEQIAGAIRRPSSVGRLQISFTGNQGFYRKEHGRESMVLENLSLRQEDLYRLQDAAVLNFFEKEAHWRELRKSQAQTFPMGQHYGWH